jgi:hypothetical protein
MRGTLTLLLALASSAAAQARPTEVALVSPSGFDGSDNPAVEADAVLRQPVSDAFLIGRTATAADAAARRAIASIVQQRFDDMGAYYRDVWRPQQPAEVRARLPGTLTIVSRFRSFGKQAAIAGEALAKEPLFAATSADEEIEQAILNVLSTISAPGFSRHAWGSDIDVVSATRSRWEGRGRFVALIPFLATEAPRFGFYHPYSDRRLSDTLPHHKDEPWHLSYWPIASAMEDAHMERISGEVLDDLITRAAKAIHGRVDEGRMRKILAAMSLPSFRSNVAPAPE